MMDEMTRMRNMKGVRRAPGFTLVEVLVAVVVGLLVLVGVHSIFVGGLKTQTTTSLQMEVNRKAQLAMDDLTDRLRGGSAVVEAYSDKIVFTDQDGNNVRYWLNSGKLYRVLNAASYSGGIPVASNVSEFALEYRDLNGQPAATAAAAAQVIARVKVERERHSCLLRSGARLRNR